MILAIFILNTPVNNLNKVVNEKKSQIVVITMFLSFVISSKRKPNHLELTLGEKDILAMTTRYFFGLKYVRP